MKRKILKDNFIEFRILKEIYIQIINKIKFIILKN